ncbi:hypothetical protein FACS1894137_15460 [Spirochaetia bacterium]|nr:hypothetical protein FACS1894137_15460 [Spirochaetia bacterium]
MYVTPPYIGNQSKNIDKVLIIGAHYDDAELGAGGTGARFISEGKEVYKITLTDNVTVSSYLDLNVDNESSRKDSKKACEILGITELPFEPVEDCKLKYSKEIMQQVEAIIFDNKIDTVFMHFEDDYNQDHIEAYLISKTASRHCRNILTYQSNAYQLPTAYYPSVFSDISEFAEKKIAALHAYGEQHDRFGKLFEINMDRNKVWGYALKVEYAEAFCPIKLAI